MVSITHEAAMGFCAWLTERERRAGRLPGGQVYRLPTEAEWEYACRAGSETAYCFGDNAGQLDDYAWYGSNSGGQTHDVGRKKPNAWGLYDMHGNVSEWCSDRYDNYPRGAVTDPTGPGTGWGRVIRGGGWGHTDGYCRSTYRSLHLASRSILFLGFRLARAPSPTGSTDRLRLAPEATEDGAAPQTGKDWTVPDLGMEFVWVKALKCWVGKYEVTNDEYRKKEPRHDSKEYKKHSLNQDRQPVVYVNYDNAQKYAKWLTAKEQKAGRLPKGMKYRLPTEKEWQTFAQCGDGREYPWGDDWPPKYGNYSDQSSASRHKIDDYNDGFAVTCSVEKSGKNDWGLYGVGGNVWECCSKEPSGAFGAWRGASWHLSFSRVNLRCSYRIVSIASFRSIGYGFRLVLSR